MEQDFHQMFQNIITLAPLTSNLPIIQTPEGEYVPLRVLCEIVGLNPASYIGVFCQYYQPGETRRRLAWDSPAGRRKDWCLPRGWLIYWLVVVPIDRVPPDRREAVLALQRQSAALLGNAYTEMQEHHREARRVVFQLLNVCAQREEQLDRIEALGFMRGRPSMWRTLEEQIEEGRQLIKAIADSARKMLAQLMEGPIVDGVVLNKQNEVIDTTSFPLIPVEVDFDPATLEKLKQLNEWTARFNQWLDAHMR